MVGPVQCAVLALLCVVAAKAAPTQEGKPVLIGTLKHEAPAWGLRFSPDGQTLTAVVRTKQKLVRWDLKTLKQRTVIESALKGWIEGETYSSDGRLLVTEWTVTGEPPAGDERAVRVWDLETGKETMAYRGSDVMSSALSHDGKLLAFTDSYKPIKAGRRAVKLLDPSTGKEVYSLPDHGTISVYGVTFSPDGKTLALSGPNRGNKRDEVRLLDVNTRKVRATLTSSVGLMQLLFSPDGKTFATRSWNVDTNTSELKLWDAATGKEKFELKGHRAQIMGAVFSPDGRLLATGSGTLNFAPALDPAGLIPAPPNVTELKLWDVRAGKELANLGGHKKAVYEIEFSPDARLLATASGFPVKPGELKLWDVKSGKPLSAPDGMEEGVTSLVFSPDSKTLAVSDGKGIVRLWDVSGMGHAPKR